ncbi:MAG: hypothetical protein HRT77_15245, partial [Halioglobus sp.]|nr:hypothetical protein [Halioglobus sp.]
MTHSASPLYAASVLEQKDAIAAIYGNVDFAVLPERYVSDRSIVDTSPQRFRQYAEKALSDPALVDIVRNYTMTGDRVADAYAALIPKYGFRRLITLLETACADVSWRTLRTDCAASLSGIVSVTTNSS